MAARGWRVKESSISATAVVTVTDEIHLEQSWGGDATIDRVDKRARDEASEHIERLRTALSREGARVVGEPSNVRIILNTKAP